MINLFNQIYIEKKIMIKLNYFIFIIKLFLVILKKEYNYSRNKERKRIIYLSKKMKKYHYLYHKNYIMRLFFWCGIK